MKNLLVKGRGEGHRKTIVEITNGSAFRMGHLCVGRELEPCLDLWQIQPAILFATPNHPTLARENLFQGGLVAIQAIEAHDEPPRGEAKPQLHRR